MKKLTFLCLLLMTFAFKSSQNWVLEPGYKISFSIGYWAGTCPGSIKGLIGSIIFDENALNKSSFNFGVDITTLSTGSDLRDTHLKKEEYFNTLKYPIILFKSTAITKTPKGYLAEGNLTIKATTKKVQLPFSFTSDKEAGVFYSNFKINRLDYFVGESTWKLKDSVTVNVVIPVKKT